MRAYVYVVNIGSEWRAMMSICPEIDRSFWMDSSRWGSGERREGAARSGWLWKQELPLGDACRAVELWGEQGVRWEDRKRGREQGQEQKEKHELKVLLRLQACVEQAVFEGGGREREVVVAERGVLGGLVSLLKLGKLRKLGKTGKTGKTGKIGKTGKPGMPGMPGKLSESGGERAQVSELVEQRKAILGQGKASELEGLIAEVERAAGALQGRALLRSEVHDLLAGAGCPEPEAGWSALLQLAALLGRVRLSGAVAYAASGGRADARGRRRRERRCLRCGSGEALLSRSACAACGRTCAYCTACIGMGRSRECELLVTAPISGEVSGVMAPIRQRLAKWGLSPAQTAAAEAALHFVEKGNGTGARGQGNRSPNGSRSPNKTGRDYSFLNSPSSQHAVGQYTLSLQQPAIRSFLLWAVTGAGKTEMVFPLLESVLLRGGRALLATPRRDVVIELDPRIRKAFPDASVVTLYGGSEQRWERGDITLATTHQLMRFYQGFELVIIDEIDAYPYHGEPLLHYAADKSCAPGAARVLLSATPPSELQREARRGRLAHARVPVRYHRHPLPVPVLLRTPTVQQMLQQRKLPSSLLTALRQSLERGAQLFIFVQRIAQTEPMAELLRASLGERDSNVEVTRACNSKWEGFFNPNFSEIFKSCYQKGNRVSKSIVDKKGYQRGNESPSLSQADANTQSAGIGAAKLHADARSDVSSFISVAATSSQDEERTTKVQRFRARDIRILVTTTILERGVTIPQSDVYIMDADGKLFDEASLVQMAGRAGRSAADPFGRVYFCSRERNRAQVSAVKHIRTMNRIARKKGFLLP